MVKLWQNVDTIKLHLYPTIALDGYDIEDYNNLISQILTIKEDSQKAKNKNTSYKENQIIFEEVCFQVMPSTVRGFSCSIKSQDVTIHLKKITRNCDPTPFSKIEFRSSYLHRLGYLQAIQNVNRFIKDKIINQYKIKISELHLHVDVQGYEFSILDFHRIKSRSRSNRYYDEGHTDSYYYNGRSFQGFMMGGGDYLMRVYNKTKEILKFPNKSFITQLWETNKDYDTEKDVYRIEFQLRRKKLKNMVLDGQILDGFEVILNNLNNIWCQCLKDFSLRDLSDKHCLEVILGYREDKQGIKKPLTNEGMRTRIKRSNIHPLWSVIETFNGHHKTDGIETYTKPFTSDFIYVHNAYKAFMSTMLSTYGTLRPEIVLESLQKVEEYTMEKHDKTVLEDVLSKKLDRFNKVTLCDDTFEKMEKDKEFFFNAVHNVFEDTYERQYEKGVSDDFYNKFVKEMVA
jgi:hypothetical protein